jgi:SAM-dependent MidA family methyltransferase
VSDDDDIPELAALLRARIADQRGWLAFDDFMALVLYAPGLGYYARDGAKFGWMPGGGSDFVTAPELSPWFGRALAVQVAQGLELTATDSVIEFGAGSGALAEQLLETLGERVRSYRIVELSGALRQRQRSRLARFGDRVTWLDRLPDAIAGVVVGNELLDAMPVKLLHWDGEHWLERGVVVAGDRFAWGDRPSELRSPVDAPFAAGTVTEIHPQAQAFVATLARLLTQGLVLLIDYGFPEAEYYHPQRVGGTLMCHRAHRADTDPLAAIGRKDITAHVDFTAIALAAQDAGLEVLGYTSQARFLVNCGLIDLLREASIKEQVMAQRLVTEHEMGELFKVIAFGRGCGADLVGFADGDRSHRL